MTDESLPRGTSPNSQTSATSQTLDYATWLTKQQAADAIGVSTKTIEQFAKDGKIQQAVWRPQNRGAAKAVYHPDDVARVAQERRGEAKAFVLPVGTALPANGNGHHVPAVYEKPDSGSALAIDLSPLASLAAVLQTLADRASTSQNSQKSAYVDKAEALAIAGVSYGELRAAVRAGEVKQRGRQYRVKDLVAL